MQEKGFPLGEHRENERQQEGRERIFPGHHGRLEGVAAGDGRGGKRRQCRGRRDLGEQGVVEDEHVGGVVRHPQLGQRRGRNDGGDDVGRRDGYGEPDDPEQDAGKDRRQEEAAPGIVDDDARQLEPQPREAHDADDDPGRRADGGHVEHGESALLEGFDQLRRREPGLFPNEGNQKTGHDRCKDRDLGGEAGDQKADDGCQRKEVVAIALEQLGGRAGPGERDRFQPEFLGIELHHEQQPPVVERGGDGGEQDDIQVADPQELGDQKGRRAHDRRGGDGAHAAGGQKPPGVVAVVAGLRQHGVGHGSDGHGVGNPRAGDHGQEIGGGHHRAAGGRRLLPHAAKAKST